MKPKKLHLLFLALAAGLMILAGCSRQTAVSTAAPNSSAAAVIQTAFSTEAETSAVTKTSAEAETTPETTVETEVLPDESGTYLSKEEVALYLHLYGHLPGNYITKKKASSLGWESSKGNLWDVLPSGAIGGDRFGNYEGQLPDQNGRTWYECDVNYHGGYREAERVLYSNDGLIYYTADHYKSFELLYTADSKP